MNNLTVIQNAECQFAMDAPHAGETYQITEVATGASLGRINLSSADEVNAALAAAHAAQADWAATDFETRANVMRKFAQLLEQNADLIHAWNARECGSILPKSQWELKACIDQAYMSADLALQPNGEIFPSSMPGRDNRWVRVPVGVVGVISPWNFPMLLSLRSVMPALVMGNAVVMKPDLQSSVIGGVLLLDLLREAGVPEGVCQLVLGGAEVGQQLVEHPLANMIAFTGSTAVGRIIGEHCGRTLKKSSLELGGNNAMIVCEDADLTSAASCGAWGAFLHQGQICMQSGRHIVSNQILDQYVETLAARAKNLVTGNPFTQQSHLGPLINDRQAERVMRLIEESVAMGAEVVCGGQRDGRFISATVIRNVTPDMPIYKEEIFGPVAPVIGFDSDAEAIALANDSDYGLSAAIHSGNLVRANAMAQQIHAGMVHINDQTVNNEYQVPFGGMKCSGNSGRFGGPANLDEFTERKWISTMAASIQYPF
ncbi:MAG: aldehyde dehydrogenase family protein [Oceanobacter sp.]